MRLAGSGPVGAPQGHVRAQTESAAPSLTALASDPPQVFVLSPEQARQHWFEAPCALARARSVPPQHSAPVRRWLKSIKV